MAKNFLYSYRMSHSILSIKQSLNIYLLSEYDGGAVLQYNDEGKPEGWVAKRWNKKVRERFALLLQALGKEFDGKIEGINLQETAIGVSKNRPKLF